MLHPGRQFLEVGSEPYKHAAFTVDSPDFMVSKPTYRELLAEGAAWGLCACGAFFTVSEPTTRVLLARSSACLFCFRTYLQRTIGQECSMFIRFSNLPSGDCQPRVQHVYMVSEMQPVCTVSGPI